jgi:hypothetical protein
MCGTCNTRLAVVQRYAVLLGFLSLLAGAGLGAYASIRLQGAIDRDLTDVEFFFVMLVGVVPWLVLQFRVVPRFCRLRPAAEKEQLHFPLRDETAEADRNADLEYEKGLRDEHERIQAINDPRRRDWTCAACGAENPSTFDICWKCKEQGPRGDI